MKILKKSLIIAAVLVVVAGVGYAVSPNFVEDKIVNIVKTAKDIAQSREIFSVPLVGTLDNANAKLTVAGIIAHTNTQRSDNAAAELSENSVLDAAAQKKVSDMFARQYFEHVSPDGHGPGYLAQQVGYAYLIIGENLALGNFKDDSALVDAWMASPGHRANILNPRFSEIGVAVGEGVMNGKHVWLAVQEFGTPASECPAISATLKAKIDADKSESDVLAKKLDLLKHDLDTMPHATQTDRDAYNMKIDAYNQLVGQYGALTTGLRTEVDQYNAEVRAFNACLNG